MTKKKNVEDRIKELQTGNGKELFLYKKFQTKYPYKVEKMLHFHYQKYHENGEWFRLDDENVNNFLNECENKEKICDCLKDSPFF